MPAIKQYEAPPLGLSPSDKGVDAEASAGRLIGRFYNQSGELMRETGAEFGSAIKAAGDVAVKYAEHSEISHGAPTFANARLDLTESWNNIAKNTDPNDTTVAQRFREQVLEPKLDELRKGFLTEGGQKFAESQIDSIRNHMFEKTAADMSSLAKDAVAVNVRQTANSLSNNAMLDPSSVPHLLDSADGLIGGMVGSAPNLKGADASRAHMELTEKMKEAVVKAGAQGAIMKAADPEAEATKWGQKYPQYISGAELKTLASNAHTEIRARNYDYEINRRREKEIATDKSNGKFNDYYVDAKGKDPRIANDPTAQKILHDPDLLKGDKSSLINLIGRELKPETDARISAQTSAQLFRMSADPNADPAKVRQAIIDARSKDPGTAGSLSKSDYDFAMKDLEGLKTPEGAALASDRGEFVKRYGPTIDASMSNTKSENFGHFSALGDQRIYALEKDARRMEQQLKAKGQDPHSLYDPSSPNFLGRSLQKYMVSMQDAMNYDKKLERQNSNITGPDKTITGIDVQNMDFKPPSDWKFSPSRAQYRDPGGKIYDLSGKPVK